MSLWRAVGLSLLFLGGFIALGFFNRAVAELLLEALKVFLSWPVVTLSVLIYFIHTQRTVLSDVIARITKLGFAGGEVVVAPSYPPPSPPTTKEFTPPITQTTPSGPDQVGVAPADVIQKLERDFNNLLLYGFRRNKFFVQDLAGCGKTRFVCFDRLSTNGKPQ